MNVVNKVLVCDLFSEAIGFVASIYRTPSQSSNKYNTFFSKFRTISNILILNPHVLLVKRDFNVRSSR